MTIDTSIIYIILGMLFLLNYLFKKNSGVLIWSLAIGLIISTIWQGQAVNFVLAHNWYFSGWNVSLIVKIILCLLPSIVVLLTYPANSQNVIFRILNSALVTVMVAVCLMSLLRNGLIITGLGNDIFRAMIDNDKLIIGFCLVLGTVEMAIEALTSKLKSTIAK